MLRTREETIATKALPLGIRGSTATRVVTMPGNTEVLLITSVEEVAGEAVAEVVASGMTEEVLRIDAFRKGTAHAARHKRGTSRTVGMALRKAQVTTCPNQTLTQLLSLLRPGRTSLGGTFDRNHPMRTSQRLYVVRRRHMQRPSQ
jgi:small ligand-binding sensory domain FIST